MPKFFEKLNVEKQTETIILKLFYTVYCKFLKIKF